MIQIAGAKIGIVIRHLGLRDKLKAEQYRHKEVSVLSRELDCVFDLPIRRAAVKPFAMLRALQSL
jgi:hypothetical protein